MAKLIPAWQPIAIGSVPYTDAEQAWSVVLRYLPQTPCWPQLPQRSYKENMYVQYSERFPGVVLEEQRIYVDRRQDLDPGLERLYLAYLSDDVSYGAIGPDFSAALAALQDGRVTFVQTPLLLKGQVTGPVSWGLTVVDQNRRPLLYDEILGDAVAKHLRMKAGWQQAVLSAYCPNTLIFIDEPYLCAYGSAFVAVSREQIVRYLHEVLAEITGLKGAHCCGNTDWSILLDTPIDVLSLDAYDYGSTLALYPEAVSRFLERGGFIAWGIVPNTSAAEAETAEALVERLERAIDALVEKGVSRDALLKQGLVSPACGTGSLSTTLAERVFDLTAQVSALMRERYGTAEVKQA